MKFGNLFTDESLAESGRSFFVPNTQEHALPRRAAGARRGRACQAGCVRYLIRAMKEPLSATSNSGRK